MEEKCKKQTVWQLVLDCFLLLMIVVLCVYSTVLYCEKKYKTSNLGTSLTSTAIVHDIVLNNWAKQLESDNTSINDVLCYSESGDSVKISSLLKKQEGLIILYGGNSYCNSCIDYHMNMLNNKAHFINGNIIILFKNVSSRELMIIKSNNRLEIPIYATVEHLSLLDEDDGQPRFFLLNENLFVSNTFYPIKGNAEINNVFYKFLMGKYPK